MLDMQYAIVLIIGKIIYEDDAFNNEIYYQINYVRIVEKQHRIKWKGLQFETFSNCDCGSSQGNTYLNTRNLDWQYNCSYNNKDKEQRLIHLNICQKY